MGKITIKKILSGTTNDSDVVLITPTGYVRLSERDLSSVETAINQYWHKNVEFVLESNYPLPSMTISEAARRFSIPPTTIRSWIESGRLAVVEGDKPFRVLERDIAKIIDERKPRYV